MSSVRDFGAVGDGVADDTEAVRHAVENGDGLLEFPRGIYLLTGTVEVDLARAGFHGIAGAAGTARIVAAGSGPAFRLVGTHGGTGDPGSVAPAVWTAQRMPVVADLEIEGRHPEADGIELVRTMQAIVRGVLVRRTRHGLRLRERNRNLLVDACHFYDNTGCGIFFDGVNLHQANVTGCHISYNRLGGIRIERSEVRNLQVTGNDIEYNNHRTHDTAPVPVADILVDASAAGASVREVTIASNTIQATHSPGGANIRILGNPAEPNQTAGMLAITGNVIGSQETAIHLRDCRDVTLSGNFVYSSQFRNLHVERSRRVVVGSNGFGHNPDYRDRELATGIRFEHCETLNLHGLVIQDARAGRHTLPDAIALDREGLVELVACRRATLAGCQVLDGTPFGLLVRDSHGVHVSGCTIEETRDAAMATAAVRWEGPGSGNRITDCLVGPGGPERELRIDPDSGVGIDGC